MNAGGGTQDKSLVGSARSKPQKTLLTGKLQIK